MNFKKIIDEKLEEWVIASGFIFIVLLVFAQVVFRYVFNSSLGWSAELSRYVLIWLAWISVSLAIRKNAHIRVEVVKKLFSDRFKLIIEFIVLVLWVTFSVFLAYLGFQFVKQVQLTGQTSPSIGIPMWIVYLVVPISGALMIMRLIQQFYFVFKTDPSEQKGG
ncbi:hypothetical protein GCM10008983_07910 [Lentibacillus halophilus]|uniref:Tripartite ATP-independent periplasmic transporters DctQ component domain-containing protein n=1 Tax=Lentibacillus halophilus TaxID=295065 RepID=A0ABP3J0I7_9BACI